MAETRADVARPAAPGVTSRWRSPWRRRLPILILAAAFAHNLSYTWLKWGDLVIDGGRELDVPLQLAQGRVLYSEVRFYYGPVAAYFNAGLFKLFGAHAEVLFGAGGISALLMLVLLYRLARLFTGRLAAAWAAAAFLYLCAFGHFHINGVFNFVFPYAYTATYGMLLATASLYFLVRHARPGRGRSADFFLSAACLALALLSKLEVLFAAGATHVVFIAASAWTGRFRVRLHLSGYLGVLFVAGAVYGCFAFQAGSGLIGENLFLPGIFASRAYLRMHSGLGAWQDSLRAMLFSGALFAVAVWAMAALARIASRPGLSAAGLGLLLFSSAGVTGALFGFVSIDLPLRALPLLLAAFVILTAVRGLREREREACARHLPALLLGVFGLACLARMPLLASALHFGFYLLPVGLVALAVFWFVFLAERFSRPGPGRQVFALGGTGLFLALGLGHYLKSRELYAMHTELLETPRGSLYLMNHEGRGQVLAEAVRVLGGLPPATRVLVVPQGAGLTFFSGLTNATGMHYFLPLNFHSPDSEDRLIAAWSARPPDLVVALSCDLSEFGARGFGIDFGQRCWAWIQGRYTTWRVVANPLHSVVILKPKIE